jgi:hypothetical protein
MWKKIQERIFPFIIATSALSVSASAAFYSVSGLSKLFAGASLAVIIMAGSLEVAKLVIASLLYQYRETIPKLLKYYLTTAAVVLVLITSMGIYGFLSAAYQETASKAGTIDAQIALVEVKRDNIKEQLAVYNAEKESINEAVADLRSGLSNNTIQYKDRETGQIITTTSSSNRKALEKQLDQAIARQTEINSKVDALNEQLFGYETEIVEISTNDELAGELGPLKYLSGLTGVPMDKIINILLLTIIFVFDPLAIALVVAANYAFERLRPKTKENIYGEKFVDGDLYEDGEEWEEEDEEWDEDHALDQVLNNMVDDLPNIEDKEEVVTISKSLLDRINRLFEVIHVPEIKKEEDDWKIEDEEKNLKPELNEFDMNKDGKLSAEELFLKEQIKKLKQDKSLGEFRIRRTIERLKREFKEKNNPDDDLTITY